VKGERGAALAARRTRRRFARRQWRRRWLAWRYLAVFALVLAGVGGGSYALWFSSWLDVETVEVRGTETLTVEQVRERAGIDDSLPLARVDIDATRARIAAIAAVRTVEVSRNWPDTVLIQVSERVPLAVVELGGQLRGMDAEGVVFVEYEKAPPELPRVRLDANASAEARREAALVVTSLPEDVIAAVEYLSVVSADRISLFLVGGREVVWGSAADSATKARVLAGLLATVEAEVYDVSVPSNPATRP
jgi:cell division protein FtsQ